MATKSHQQTMSAYPENFNRREARLLAAGYSLLQLSAENFTIATDDSYTHVTLAGNCTLTLPAAAANKGRVFKVYSTAAAGTKLIQDAAASAIIADLADSTGAELYCNGSTWVQVG
jgi:hypothetical protein